VNIISNDLQTKAQTAAEEIKAAAARWQAKKAKRIARKRNRANSAKHKAAQARRTESAGDATRHYAEHDDLMTSAVVKRQ